MLFRSPVGPGTVPGVPATNTPPAANAASQPRVPTPPAALPGAPGPALLPPIPVPAASLPATPNPVTNVSTPPAVTAAPSGSPPATPHTPAAAPPVPISSTPAPSLAAASLLTSSPKGTPRTPSPPPTPRKTRATDKDKHADKKVPGAPAVGAKEMDFHQRHTTGRFDDLTDDDIAHMTPQGLETFYKDQLKALRALKRKRMSYSHFHTIESHYERRAQLAREQGTVLRIREAERQLLLKMTGIYQQVGALPEQNAVHFASLKGMSTAYRDVAKQNADAIAAYNNLLHEYESKGHRVEQWMRLPSLTTDATQTQSNFGYSNLVPTTIEDFESGVTTLHLRHEQRLKEREEALRLSIEAANTNKALLASAEPVKSSKEERQQKMKELEAKKAAAERRIEERNKEKQALQDRLAQLSDDEDHSIKIDILENFIQRQSSIAEDRKKTFRQNYHHMLTRSKALRELAERKALEAAESEKQGKIDEANQLLEESKLSQSELETLETSMRSMQEEEEAMELEDLNHSREIQDIVEDAKSTTPRKRQYLQHRLSQVEADEDQARRLSESHSNLSQQSGGDTEVQLNTTLNTAFSQVTTSLAQIDRKSTRLNSSHVKRSRMPSSA